MNSLMRVIKDLPCKECVCWPICQRKNYFKAMDDCKILVNFMGDHQTLEQVLGKYYFNENPTVP